MRKAIDSSDPIEGCLQGLLTSGSINWQVCHALEHSAPINIDRVL